jgi:phenylalanine-4-hydroxylase
MASIDGNRFMSLKTEAIFKECVVEQNWDAYTQVDHKTWTELFARMSALLPTRMCHDFLSGLKDLKLTPDRVVNFDVLSETLTQRTGWKYVAVNGFIPNNQFFALLANRCFPSSRLMRDPDGLVYQESPDIFHDVFGHAPLLMNPVIADFMQAFGAAGVACKSELGQQMLARLYWFTVEVGLVRDGSGLRAYGAALASSEKELIFSLLDSSPNRLGFEQKRVVRTPYFIDDLQETYFVVDTLDQVLALAENDFSGTLDMDFPGSDITRGALIESDLVISRGNQRYQIEFGKHGVAA